MHVCMHACSVCMCVCLFVCVYVCVYVSVCVCMYVCMYVCMFVCMYVCVYACMYVCMYACMHVCVYVCMHACMQAMYAMYAMYACMCSQHGLTIFPLSSCAGTWQNSMGRGPRKDCQMGFSRWRPWKIHLIQQNCSRSCSSLHFGESGFVLVGGPSRNSCVASRFSEILSP
jgi:hypothetical protein